MEKLQLSFDELNYNAAIRKVRALMSEAQKVVGQINEINSYKVDQAGLYDLLGGRGETIAAGIEKAIETELASAGIHSSGIRRAAVKNDLEKYYSILNTFTGRGTAFTSFLSINEAAEVVLPPETEASIRDEYTHYIKTEKGLEIYTAHKKMIKAMNDLLAMTPQISPLEIRSFFSVAPQQKQADIILLDYDRLAQ